MTLFDGQLITEREVELRQLCECGHTLGQHRGDGGECVRCGTERTRGANRGCEEFALAALDQERP